MFWQGPLPVSGLHISLIKIVGMVKINLLIILFQAMLCSQQEKSLLQDAVKTMMAQICKVGVTYHNELQIEGTVVVTVDQQKVIVIHFDDRFPFQLTTTQPSQADNNVIIPASSQDVALNDGCRLMNGETSSSATSAAKSGWYEGSSTSKMMNSLTELDESWNDRVAIDLDAEPDTDSHSVSTPNFEENSCSFGHGGSMDDVTLARECQSSLGERKGRRVKDAKNVIVIEDNELFSSAGTLQETVEECSSIELKQLSGFAARSSTSSTADCESVGDAADLRSLTNDFVPDPVDPVRPVSQFHSAILACEVCGWHARTVSDLESHLVSQHGVTESERLGHSIKSVSCPVCSKRFRFFAHLSKHMSGHSAKVTERPYRCRSCRNSYRNAQSLALHSHVHDKTVVKGSRLTCTLCYKTYPNKVLFQKHIIYMHERIN